MDEAMSVARQATRDITAWLWSRPETVDVHNVENEDTYRTIDVDLLWVTQKACYQVEIKGDRWDKTGNVFLETHSNVEKGTPGCFLYTEADLLFYYFVHPKTLYIFPMPETRVWFVPRKNQYRVSETQTPVGNRQYTTRGCLVPLDDLRKAGLIRWKAQL
jgi:hypothetical protein